MNMEARLTRAVQHFLQILFKEGQIQVEIHSTDNKPRSIWCTKHFYSIAYIKYVNPESDKCHIAKIYKNCFSDDGVENELFQRELHVQTVVLDRMERLLNAAMCPYLYDHYKKYKILIVDNVLEQKYVMIPPTKGLSLDESIEAIELMAKLHAASVALFEEKPEIVKVLKIESILEKSDHLMTLFNESKKRAIDLMEKIYPHIATKLKSFQDITMQHIIDLYAYDPKEFCVLNNGDFSIANLLFHNNTVILPLLMNFQLAVYSSPAIDLLHFLNTSPSIDVIYDEDKRLLQIYLNKLDIEMKNLKCTTKPPTMKELKAAIQKRTLYAVFAGITFKLHTMIMEEGEEIVSDIYYKELATKMLLVMYCRNYFDYVNKPRSSPVKALAKSMEMMSLKKENVSV